MFADYTMPYFWLALLLMLLFVVYLELLTVSGLKFFNYDELSAGVKIMDVQKYIIFPICVSAFCGLAGISCYMKNGLLEVLQQE